MKKFLSLFLAFVMVISIFAVAPINVSATQTHESETSPRVSEDITMTGSNSLGTMLAAEFDENENEVESDKCGIYGIEMNGTIAYVDIHTFINATLIVGIFDESTDEMYSCGMIDVSKDDKIVAVKIDTNELPQFYIVKAFLVNRETKNPLCKQYECDTYTQVMQEFLSKTTEDFAEEDILNLDESEDNNFLVYGEDTIVVESTDENANIVQSADEEKREYVIENIDDTIASLKEGDIFTYEYGEEGLLIIKVSSITVDGTTAIIYGDEITLEEAFDYIKIDTSDYSAETNVDNSNLDEDIEFVGVEEPEIAPTGATLINDKLSKAKSLTYKIKEKKFGKDSSISGNVGLKSALELSCYYDAELFKKDEVKLSVKIDYELGLDVTLELKGVFVNIPLGKLGFSPAPGIYIEFTPSFIVEGEFSTQLTGTLNGQVGKIFENGVFYDDNKPATFDASLKFETDIFIGISLEPKIGILRDVISVSMEAKSGVHIKAELEYTTDNYEVLGERHLCKSCIDGEISFVCEISFKFSILEKNNLTFTATPFEYTKKIADFYYSIDNAKFAFTSCPNKDYKQTIKVLNSNGTPAASAKVNGVATNNKGEAILYLTKGEHELNIVGGGTNKSFCIFVSKSDIHTFTLRSSYDNGSSNVTASGKCGDNMYYKIYGNTLEIYGNGDMIDCPWYSFSNVITKTIIREGVTSITNNAFHGFSKLKSISIPNSVTYIGYSAFNQCKQLNNISIPNSVSYIDEFAFCECTSLTSITIPNSVTEINGWTFYQCTKIKEINIPTSVTYVGWGAFSGCNNLQDVYYGGTTKQWKSIYIDSLPDVEDTSNNSLTSANIHYNSSKAIAITSQNSNAKEIGLSQVGTEYKQMYSREHLFPESEALFVVIEGDTDSYDITSKNLLYIGQTTADTNGCATIGFAQHFNIENGIPLIFGDCDHSSSQWNISVKPTENIEGLKVCICDYCKNIIDTETIDRLNNNVLLGDTDNDGTVSVMDATEIQRHIAQLSTIPEDRLSCADANRDGQVNIMDATQIQRFIAQLIPEL